MEFWSILVIAWLTPAMFLTSAIWATSGSRRQPWSVSCDLVNINKRILRNFDRPLGLPGHRRRCFWWQQHVISLKNDGVGLWKLPLPSVVEHVATVFILQFCGKSTILHVHSPSILHSSISHFTFCFIPTPTTRRDSNEELEVDTCSPRRKAI